MNEEKTTTWQWRQGYDYATAKYKAEIDRLRDELVELRPYCETLNPRLMEAGDELKRLRAENAELRQLLQTIAVRLQVAGGAFPTLIDAILAKTAKEGK